MSDIGEFGTAVQDDGFRRALLDPSSLLDVPHHDVPERHEIGKALLAPTILPKPNGIPAVGRSPAPARSDHVHGVDPVNFAGPLGRLAVGSFLAATINLPAGGPTTIANQLSFTPTLNRRYRAVVDIRAFGPQAGTAFTTGRLIVYTLPFFDFWMGISGGNWTGVHAEDIFVGDGNPTTWTLQMTNINNPAQIYPTHFYIEDIGRV